MKLVLPLNTYISLTQHSGGQIPLCRTIKAQYWKNSFANFVRQDGMGATAVLEIEYEE